MVTLNDSRMAMRLLALTDILAISGPERERLVEADDAIRDVVTLVREQAADDRLDVELMSAAIIDLLLVAAARLALMQESKADAARVATEFAELAKQAVDWVEAGSKSVRPTN
jgi:hypothetical protein